MCEADMPSNFRFKPSHADLSRRSIGHPNQLRSADGGAAAVELVKLACTSNEEGISVAAKERTIALESLVMIQTHAELGARLAPIRIRVGANSNHDAIH